jgi:glycosyltransferase involved in cell wall biosynthesis
VPVHNAAPYLAACLDGLLAQTRPVDEVILVDDGSTDDSPAILADYSSRHRTLRVLKGPQRGAAGARNAGLDAATGDWLGFVDADDLPQPALYERLLRNALEADADIALCNGTYVRRCAVPGTVQRRGMAYAQA